MWTKNLVLIVMLLSGGLISACNDPLAQSHVDANVPPAEQFHRFLKRDLQAFFSNRHGSSVAISYALLHDGPTQTGIAYPKYYLWVKTENSAGPIEEGAIRVAARGRTRFELTHFMPKRDIQTDPAGVEQVFPKALAQDIRWSCPGSVDGERLSRLPVRHYSLIEGDIEIAPPWSIVDSTGIVRSSIECARSKLRGER